jgi:hypothetical protein
VEAAVIVVLQLAREVNVRIDEARQQRRIAEIDHARVRRCGLRIAHGKDLLALHDDDAAVRQAT